MKIKSVIILTLIFLSTFQYNSHARYIYGARKKEYINYANKGIKLLRKKNYQRAMRYFYFAAKYFPTKHGKITKGNIYYLIGYCYYKLSEYDKALKWFKKSLNFNPKSLSTYREIIRTLRKKNDIKKARQMAYQIEMYEFKSKKVILHVAYLFQLAKIYNRALSYYQHVLLNDNTNLYALKQSANCYIELEKFQKAIDILKRVLIKTPENNSAITLLAIAYFKTGMHKKAETLFVKLLQQNSKNYVAYYNLACIYAQKQDNERALKLLERALQLGYANFRDLKNDTDFGNLRSTEKFKSLVNKYQDKVKKRNTGKLIKKPFKNAK